jgi:hypothetical protein
LFSWVKLLKDDPLVKNAAVPPRLPAEQPSLSGRYRSRPAGFTNYAEPFGVPVAGMERTG